VPTSHGSFYGTRVDVSAGLHISFSPNGCLAIILDGEWQLHLRFMEYSFGTEDGLYDDGNVKSLNMYGKTRNLTVLKPNLHAHWRRWP